MVARLPRERYRVVKPPGFMAHKAGHLWEQTVLPLTKAELIYSPANLAPVASRRNVVVIHDLAALRHPEWYSKPYVAYHHAVLPTIAKRARLVITVSEFSRRELAQLLDLDPAHIAVVPGGVDPRFGPGVDAGGARDALGLERPYVLTVASRTARKNLGVLQTAAQRLGVQGIDLVAAGGDRPQFRDEAGTDGVRALGHVDDELLPGLYAGAAAFVLPSLYEGFGLTCLEAMACGTPVVAADRAALPEVCGDAALYVDPEDPHAVADGIERALDDTRLRTAGPARAAQFTWDRTAREVDALLHDGRGPT